MRHCVCLCDSVNFYNLFSHSYLLTSSSLSVPIFLSIRLGWVCQCDSDQQMRFSDSRTPPQSQECSAGTQCRGQGERDILFVYLFVSLLIRLFISQSVRQSLSPCVSQSVIYSNKTASTIFHVYTYKSNLSLTHTLTPIHTLILYVSHPLSHTPSYPTPILLPL